MAEPAASNPLFSDPPVGYESGHGSNVELGYGPRDVADLLERLRHQQDQALEQLRRVEEDELPDLMLEFREEFAASMGRHIEKGPLLAKRMAEGECRELLHAIEIATGKRDAAKAALSVRESQVSGAQTRARMWLAQHGENWRSGGPR